MIHSRIESNNLPYGTQDEKKVEANVGALPVALRALDLKEQTNSNPKSLSERVKEIKKTEAETNLQELRAPSRLLSINKKARYYDPAGSDQE